MSIPNTAVRTARRRDARMFNESTAGAIAAVTDEPNPLTWARGRELTSLRLTGRYHYPTALLSSRGQPPERRNPDSVLSTGPPQLRSCGLLQPHRVTAVTRARRPGRVDPVLLHLLLHRLREVMQPPRVILRRLDPDYRRVLSASALVAVEPRARAGRAGRRPPTRRTPGDRGSTWTSLTHHARRHRTASFLTSWWGRRRPNNWAHRLRKMTQNSRSAHR